ncbi:SCO1 protein [Jeotgalicoccus aerolatus]|uniref:Protein SCO1/2 n=1 Tax=Jeotgalicoccus aerolatus TaxID=709510 RepID=A0A1G9D4F0_9STAP|nr:SCO family protein [Jeotgalicoccus aerolatus]MBP1951584.1 protein SCO1/2 [Jeotgalicoccus aerolatus]CAD2076050.1 SCO1 protein [Jeotgalicoccus aerolatus]SDK58761.1 protein SCO1/2 [Jeotgalicoccus aerolatus]GGD96394.1 SCO1 protein [Jeotgalicoccus aerolatus]HJG32330.1 SCO family protein [Jeotgalicoccus aerolatus]
MKKWLIAVLASLMFLSACSAGAVEPMSRYGDEIQDFEVTNQNDETFTREDMDGKVWLLSFIFTNCATVCPPMTQNMTQVTQELDEKGIENYGVMSFSVDPEVDTPEVLTEYAGWYDIPEDTDWQFLTGYDYEFIRGFAEDNFKTIVAPPPEGSDQVTHGTAFYLIDENGTIIKDYPGVDSGDNTFPQAEVVSDVEKLVEQKDEE